MAPRQTAVFDPEEEFPNSSFAALMERLQQIENRQTEQFQQLERRHEEQLRALTLNQEELAAKIDRISLLGQSPTPPLPPGFDDAGDDEKEIRIPMGHGRGGPNHPRRFPPNPEPPFVRYDNRWENGIKIEIPEFDGGREPEDLLDWEATVEETLELKDVSSDKVVI
ncbi:uncharacterized protein LOC143885793 [Tasmannia lanceolata]|uniref:uncharacterized protein LOC143885793 n=1 Tax=Tasmannia lanceolata TaxID=3420 RepID=UPI004063BD1C